MRRALWLLAALVLVLLGVGIYLAPDRGGPKLPIEVPVGKGCRAQTSAGVVNLYPEQMANAATIAAVGVVKGIPDRGIVVALAAAMQESELYNLSGGDRDSIGLFQQRPSMGWGTVAQVSDPRYASRAFYNKLLRIDGWEEMRLTDAAQAVQRSAYPEAYQKWASDAQVLGDALVGAQQAAIACEKVGEPTLRGAAAADALADSLRADWGPLVSSARVIDRDSLSVAPAQDRAGWQLAAWLVANSGTRNVSRVRFAGHEWNVQSGEWSQMDTGAVDSPDVVIAEVYPG
ncbi:MAG TPA: hypothetical protein VH561_12375 [Micromonosporaceae bacterium]|jgi:hypothetical protein